MTDADVQKDSLKRKKDDRVPNTCEWILGSEELTTWQDSGSILWLHGNPGTGKSTMSIFLAENLSKQTKTKPVFFLLRFEFRRTKDSHCSHQESSISAHQAVPVSS